MKIFDLLNADGRLHAFEIPNGIISRRSLTKILSSIPGVEITRRPLFFSRLREEEFCEFSFSGETVVACEPFGDNSRYLIGRNPPGHCDEIAKLREAFVGLRVFAF